MDLILLKFISENWLTISFVLVILKGIAQITPWAEDDQIVQIITGAFGVLKPKSNNNKGAENV